MNTMQGYVLVLGRVLMSAAFLVSGVGKIFGFAQTEGFMASLNVPMPGVLLMLSIAIELVAGLGLLLGVYPRWSALLLMAWLVPVTVVVFPFWAQSEPQAAASQTDFMQNVMIMAGLLALFAAGSGPWSLRKDPQ